ncbi:MAG: Ig-like domain-containing protein, partial [Holophagales bacterium]|nr:Ig-like domain-containing protein [Holophagales bacterium]
CGNITIITVTEKLVCHDVDQNTATTHASPVLSVRASHREGSGTIVPRGEALHISGTSTDPDGVQPLIVFLDGSPLPPGSFPESGGSFQGSIDTSVLAEGGHELAVISVDDPAVNPVPAMVRLGFQVVGPGTCQGDTSGPQLSLTPPDGAVVGIGSPVPIDISASDPSGIDRVRIFVDGQAEALLPGGAGPWHHEWNAGDGEHELLVRAFDTCDNSADLRHTVRGCSGPQPPGVTLTAPAAGAELIEGETVSLSATASDDGGVDRVVFLDQSGAELGRDSTPPYTVSWTASAGTTQIKARAYDTCTQATTDVISVTVRPPTQPAEIQVSHGNNVLTQGEALDFGVFTVEAATKNRGITVTNLAPAGAGELHVSQIQVINTVGSAFSWGGNVVPLVGGASDNFALRFSIAEVGQFEAEVRIWHDAPGIANPRTFRARVEVEDHPRLRLRLNGGTHLDPGATLAWGTLDHGSENNAWGGWRYVLVARNHSPAAPLVLGWQLVHSQGNGFSMGGNDLAPTVGAFKEDAFVLRLDTTKPGTHQAQLRISHNDPSLPDPFVIHLAGTVRQAERLQVAHGGNILDNGELKDFGTFVAGSGIKNRAITVSNLAPAGGSGLEWGPVQVVDVQGSAFFTGGSIVSPLAPGASDDFTVRFDTATPGTYRATFEVWHSDPSAPNPHRFDARMVVTPPPLVTIQIPAVA